jgi:flavin reductase (DIM6/NTAB) family NADH-FMN oxidoreductase RutF
MLPPRDQAAFDRLVNRLDYPMLVVTAEADGERAGCLVGFATQCSIQPARFLVCLSRRNHTFRVAGRAGTLVVHALGPDDRALAALFGRDRRRHGQVRPLPLAARPWRAGAAGLSAVVRRPGAGPLRRR